MAGKRVVTIKATWRPALGIFLLHSFRGLLSDKVDISGQSVRERHRTGGAVVGDWSWQRTKSTGCAGGSCWALAQLLASFASSGSSDELSRRRFLLRAACQGCDSGRCSGVGRAGPTGSGRSGGSVVRQRRALQAFGKRKMDTHVLAIPGSICICRSHVLWSFTHRVENSQLIVECANSKPMVSAVYPLLCRGGVPQVRDTEATRRQTDKVSNPAPICTQSRCQNLL